MKTEKNPRLCGCGQPSLPKTHACADCEREARDWPPVPPEVQKALFRKNRNVGATEMISHVLSRQRGWWPSAGNAS